MEGISPLSALQRQILQFFLEHSNAVETVRGMATWLGAEPQAIESGLKGLVDRHWLSSHATDAVTGYTLTSDERSVNQIRRILELP